MLLTETAARKEGRGGIRGEGRALLASLFLLLLAADIAYIPLFRPDVRKESSSRTAERILAKLEEAIVAAEEGEILSGEEILGPDGAKIRRGRGGAILPFSIQAWAELRFPDRTVRVVPPGGPAPGPGEIVVVIREHHGLGSRSHDVPK
jgi:hypothetical protein